MITPQQEYKLTQLFNCPTRDRFAFLHKAEIQSTFIYQLDLEGPPSVVASRIAVEFIKFKNTTYQEIEKKLTEYIDAQPLPDFIQEYQSKGLR